jgi:hypothetical protein
MYVNCFYFEITGHSNSGKLTPYCMISTCEVNISNKDISLFSANGSSKEKESFPKGRTIFLNKSISESKKRSFKRQCLQVRASMSIKEKLRQVRSAICVNRREIAYTRLEAIAGADNPYSLITIFGRGHLAIKTGGAVNVTRCAPIEVLQYLDLTRTARKKYQ